MMQDVYNISRDTMENLLNHLRHPSYENAVLRESIMQRLHSEIQIAKLYSLAIWISAF